MNAFEVFSQHPVTFNLHLAFLFLRPPPTSSDFIRLPVSSSDFLLANGLEAALVLLGKINK